MSPLCGWNESLMSATKSFHRKGCERIQMSATFASVQRWIWENGNFELSITSFANFMSKTAAPNSNRGIESRLSGATFVLEMRNSEVEWDVKIVVLMYRTVVKHPRSHELPQLSFPEFLTTLVWRFYPGLWDLLGCAAISSQLIVAVVRPKRACKATVLEGGFLML